MLNEDEILDIANDMAFMACIWIKDDSNEFKDMIHFAKLVANAASAKERETCEKRFMQLFLDPDNQPTQFGTATQEYREQEIAEIRNLLFAFADRIRTTHLYGPEVKKMLEQEEAIRARGEAT